MYYVGDKPEKYDMDNLHQYKKSTLIGVGADLPKTEKESHYVDNDAMYQALLERRKLVEACKENGEPLPRVTDFIGKCLYQIADNLSQKYQFRNYPFRSDMVNDAVFHMLRYVDSFDPAYTKNPFSYFTQTAYYSFLSTIDIEKDYLASKFKMTLEKIATQDVSEHDEEYHQMVAEENLPDTSSMSDFLQKYDRAREKRRNSRKQETKNNLEDFME